jgi:CopG family nickel-responsive transcriptional regulator
MDGVTRIGVSLEPELLEKFDRHIESKGYVSRSEAIRDLIREQLSENEWKDDNQHMVGAVIIIFDSKVTDIMEKLGNIQTDKSGCILSSNRIALDGGKFMDIISVQGTLSELKKLKNEYTSMKGVLRGKLTMVSPSKGFMHYIGSKN